MEELNPLFKICNQNVEPSTTYPFERGRVLRFYRGLPCKASITMPKVIYAAVISAIVPKKKCEAIFLRESLPSPVT